MLPKGLIDAVIWQESRGNPSAVNPKSGAQGLMQVMPATGAQPGFGIQPLSNPFDAAENKRFGTQYMTAMMNRYGGNLTPALAAYNWGPGHVDKWQKAGSKFSLLPAETQNYVKSITNRMGQKMPMNITPKFRPRATPAGLLNDLVAQPERSEGLLGISGRDLMALGSGLLRGDNFAQGFGMGLEGVKASRIYEDKRKDKLQKRQQELAQRERLRKFIETNSANLPPAQRAALTALPPEQAAGILAKQAFAKPDEGKVIRGADGYNYWSTGPQAGQRVLPNTQKSPPKAPIGMTYVDPSNPEAGVKAIPGYLENRKEIAQAGATTVNMPAQETAYGKEVGKRLAQQSIELAQNAQKSRAGIGQLNRLEQALSNPKVFQGAGGKQILALKKAATSMGMKMAGVQDSEVAQSIANQLALKLRDPSQGAGMPGAMSDKDREFLQSMVANVDKTPGGNKAIIDAMRKVYQRTIQIDKLRRGYVKTNGRLDEGFYDTVAQYSEANPIFGDVAQPTEGAAPQAPQAGAVVDGYRFKGGNPADPNSWEQAQ